MDEFIDRVIAYAHAHGLEIIIERQGPYAVAVRVQ